MLPAALWPEGASVEDMRQFLVRAGDDFRDKAPVADIILDGVQAGTWRILIGDDARLIDRFVRTKPESAYDYAELGKMVTEA
jgi:hypothetical protein